MRVYYIGNKYDGCYYVRCLLPLIYNGWDGHKTSEYGQVAEGNQMAKGALAADIVVFQRPSEWQKVAVLPLLKKAGKKIVFDNDDTYKENAGIPTKVRGKNHKKILKNINKNLDTFIKNADLVTTTTEFLADEYRKLNPKVIVLPNCVDPDDWEEPLKNETDKVRIGLVGSVLVNQEYKPIIPLLREIDKRDDTQLVILGLPKDYPKDSPVKKAYNVEIDFWRRFKNIDWQQWVPHREHNDKLNELRLDMMLIPRNDSYFNRCKSNIKFLEASMLEIPVIAQGFSDGKSPYQVNPQDKEHMLIAEKKSDWKKWVDYLIKNPDIRKDMGKRAKQYVIENYNIQNKYELWEKAYNTI
jgi:glycosyltransferase involved in cell wall biosynthesis